MRKETRARGHATGSGILSVLVFAWLSTTAASPPASAPLVAGVWEGDTFLLSVTANEVSLDALLRQIADMVGFRIEGAAPPDRMVNVKFERWPLDQGLKRLIRPDSFAFVSDATTDTGARHGARLILLGRDGSRHATSGETSANGPPNGTQQAAVEETPAKPSSLTQSTEAVDAFNPDAPLAELLPVVTGKSEGVRTAALEALTAHTHDPRARRVLLDQVSNPDPEIRNFALSLVGPYLTEWPGAEDVVLNALLDWVPSIRQLALQLLVESSSSRRAEAIRLGRMDRDAEVRALAEELLQKAGSIKQ